MLELSELCVVDMERFVSVLISVVSVLDGVCSSVWGCFESYFKFVGKNFFQCWVFEDWFPVFVNDVFDFLRDVAKLFTEYMLSLSCFGFPSECLWSFREVYVIDFLYYLTCYSLSFYVF